MARPRAVNGLRSCSRMTGAAVRSSGRSAVGFASGPLETSALTTPDPVSLQREVRELLDAGAQALAMEVSSIGLVQGRISGMKFDVALFTNLTRDHLDYPRHDGTLRGGQGTAVRAAARLRRRQCGRRGGPPARRAPAGSRRADDRLLCLWRECRCASFGPATGRALDSSHRQGPCVRGGLWQGVDSKSRFPWSGTTTSKICWASSALPWPAAFVCARGAGSATPGSAGRTYAERCGGRRTAGDHRLCAHAGRADQGTGCIASSGFGARRAALGGIRRRRRSRSGQASTDGSGRRDRGRRSHRHQRQSAQRRSGQHRGPGGGRRRGRRALADDCRSC